eukprot:gene18160-23817_t
MYSKIIRLSNESFDWGDIPDFSDNIPLSKKINKQTNKQESNDENQSKKPQDNDIKANNVVFKPLQAPNPDWRSSLTKPNGINTGKSIKKPPVAPIKDAFSFYDLDYEDFELAMLEEENGGMNPGGGITKRSLSQQTVGGIDSGEVIPKRFFESLLDSEGLPFKYEKLRKTLDTTITVIYADPRRMTEDYKIVLSEFNKIPTATYKLSTIAINCDDPNDIRKYLKKSSSTTIPLLCDTTKQVQ